MRGNGCVRLRAWAQTGAGDRVPGARACGDRWRGGDPSGDLYGGSGCQVAPVPVPDDLKSRFFLPFIGRNTNKRDFFKKTKKGVDNNEKRCYHKGKSRGTADTKTDRE